MILQSASLLGGIPIQDGPAIRAVLDAYFSKAPFLNPMIKRGIGIISRLRSDAVGWEDPVYSGRGRPPKHGKKWELSKLLTECVPKPIEVPRYSLTSFGKGFKGSRNQGVEGNFFSRELINALSILSTSLNSSNTFSRSFFFM